MRGILADQSESSGGAGVKMATNGAKLKIREDNFTVFILCEKCFLQFYRNNDEIFDRGNVIL